MKQEVKDLQERAVSTLVEKIKGRSRELTFRAPTGSGKTRMMADMMHRILSEDEKVVFLVSTLSKGSLAQQNYDTFRQCKDEGVFPRLDPYLINTEISGEEALYIPTDKNVYVLPRDLNKKTGLLARGPLTNFLRTITEDFFGHGMGKHIILIKDECHQKTTNLDLLSDTFFERIINCSATPNLRRGQVPDVQITDDEAVEAGLIKRVEFGDENDSVEDAICKFEEIKEAYRTLEVNPCLIIQISNKEKAEEEWRQRIKPVLDKLEHQSLKWMLIVDDPKKCDTNDSVKKRLPASRWKDYAKGRNATVDVIIFKMVITEGWDIPRACMLYQVRDTKSKQLDEQVMGRVRRNPRLMDFETLTITQQKLATTAWVWGLCPQEIRRSYRVKLPGTGVEVQSCMKVRTTRLKPLTERRGFDIEQFIGRQNGKISSESIFSLYHQLQRCDNELQALCYEFTGGNVHKWFSFMSHLGKVKQEYNNYICNYSESMEEGEIATFPRTSIFVDNGNKLTLDDWAWNRNGKTTIFSFDSEAEQLWAGELDKIARKYGATFIIPDVFDSRERYLWGKNYPHGSTIRYEYYLDGIHFSYPDFILKDKDGIIHVFEVKSDNVAATPSFNKEEYERKVAELEKCYKSCSAQLSDHYFYIPILHGDEWQIKCFVGGEESTQSLKGFEDLLRTQGMK